MSIKLELTEQELGFLRGVAVGNSMTINEYMKSLLLKQIEKADNMNK